MPLPGFAYRAGLPPAGLTTPESSDQSPGSTFDVNTAVGPDGKRQTQLPQAPGTFQEHRVMSANRADPSANFTPGTSYAGSNPQRGGSPGGGDNTSYTSGNVITSQDPNGVTTVNGVPPSARKLAYGWSDYSNSYPTFVGAHLQIQWNANPNKPQLNPTPFNTEGPQQNTRYATPSPFAAGTFIG